jgi:hypothetical protein
MTKLVTLRLSTDYSRLGEAATQEDLDVYSDNLAKLLENEFNVEIHQVFGSFDATMCERDGLRDDAITSRIREIEAGDEWIKLLGSRENS